MVQEYQMFTLNENYRSTQTILDYANRLIAFNKDREPKEMVTSIPGHMDDVVTYQARSELDEVNFVVDKIESLKSSLTNYSDFAVLYRSSVLLRNLEIALISSAVSLNVGTTGVRIISSTPLCAIFFAFSKIKSLGAVVYSLCLFESICLISIKYRSR